MISQSARKQAIQIISDRQPSRNGVDYVAEPLAETFGTNVFNRRTMQKVLPRATYRSLIKCIDQGEMLDPSIADTVANAMKDWALSRGASHYTHWFQPLHGLTAEKHDSFLAPAGDSTFTLEFSGKNLIQGESDASSFPSGGIRSTFEARGYTGWDPTSPAFLMESTNGTTLCIPTIFCSYSGHALDKKTPLLRSLEVLSKQCVRLLHLLGNTSAKRVTCTVGPEQEYFLVDSALYHLRPDLITCGRALFGAKPPKGQEMEDHYWGSIKERVLAFMQNAEHELFKLGMPVKTRHNEVAPAQFEVAPIFELCNVAVDHNMLLMEVFRNVAKKHNFRVLFHEKPFSGVNGSGKHNNWSMCDDLGNNLLEPGNTPRDNMQFLVILTAIVRAMNKWGKLLRASIATAGNDHRLGANEAPPAIMSVYLGDQLTEVVEQIVSGRAASGPSTGQQFLQFGVSMLPQLPKDNTDRNRTSPFAFTGNKFEFRAVGSSQSLGFPNTVLNTMVAESFDYMVQQIEAAMQSGMSVNSAAQKIVKETLTENKRVLFNGNNYSPEWHEEAQRRGLPNFKNTVEALPVLIDADSLELFGHYDVLNKEELESRYHILLENYCKTINVETQLTSSMAATMILPAALAYQSSLAGVIRDTKAVLPNADCKTEENLLADVMEKASRLKEAIDALDHASRQVEEHTSDVLAHARLYQSSVRPAMNTVRKLADELEMVVDDALWPLPKFRELLFVY
jgi:glutamine synthetase